jgi:hypothetical protein
MRLALPWAQLGVVRVVRPDRQGQPSVTLHRHGAAGRPERGDLDP